VKQLQSGDERTYAVIFDKGDEFSEGMLKVARAHDLTGSHFTAIGAFQSATLGYFDRSKMEYDKIPIEEQVEVLSLVGDVAQGEDGPKLHAHVVVGKRDGSAHGGHVLEAIVWPTLEVIVTESPQSLQRHHDAETGLALIRV